MQSVLDRPGRASTIPGWSEFQCSQCRQLMLARDDTPETPTCSECLRGEAIRDITKAVETFNALRRGAEPFHVLSPQERAEQLAALLIDAPIPKPIRAGMATLSDRQLIDVVANSGDLTILAAGVAELAGRIDAQQAPPIYSTTAADAPDAATRDEIESRIEVIPDGEFLDAERWDGLS